MMADLCRKLATSPSAHWVTQSEAQDLADNVEKLQGPPEHNPWREEGQGQAQKNRLHIRIAYLLTREFRLLGQGGTPN